MNTFTQPKGSTAIWVNLQTLARIYGIAQSAVGYLNKTDALTPYTILYEPATATAWEKGSAAGIPVSWTISGNTMSLVTSTGTYTLNKAVLTKQSELETAKGRITVLEESLDSDPDFAGTVATALENKQTKDATLTAISGKSAAGLASYMNLSEAVNGVVLPGVLNLNFTVTTAIASATVTADAAIVMENMTGKAYKIANISQVINLASLGLGGMDVGSVPTSGFVALYLMYNPTTQVSGVIAVNATSTIMPKVYGGSNAPSGFTCSCLLTIVPVASSVFAICLVHNDEVRVSRASTYSGTVGISSVGVAINLAAVPLNTKHAIVSAQGYSQGVNTGTTLILSPTSNPLLSGALVAAGQTGTDSITSIGVTNRIPVLENSRTIYRTVAGNTMVLTVQTLGYIL